jgi:lysophospholipase L1-like esterase
MVKTDRLIKIAFVLVSTIVALVCAEFLLRASSKYHFHLFDVEMWRYAREIKRESSLPGFVEEHRPDAEAKLMGVSIRTDSAGFRRPDPDLEHLRKPSDRIIVALGDSLTLGWGVAEGQTYPDILEKTLNQNRPECKVSVLNAGIGNSNTTMELARYEHDIRPLHPDWLILGFFINDAEPDPKPVQSRMVRNSALANLIALRLMTHSSSSYQNYEAYYRELYQSERPGWVRLQSALAKLGQDLQRDNVRATILLLPEMHEPRNFGPFRDIYQKVSAMALADGFEVIDGSGEFPAGPGTRFWVAADDAHPNAEAQQIFASALAKSKYASEGNCKR